MHTIYEGGGYQFYYAALVGDVNSRAYSRLDADYNFAGYPSCFFDGGAAVLVGGYPDAASYTNLINQVYHDPVDDLYLSVSMEWIAGDQFRVDVELASNDLTNAPPEKPALPSGPAEVDEGGGGTYVTSTTDLDGDQIWYQWCVGEFCLDWYGPYAPGDTCQLSRTFGAAGEVEIHVTAKDNWEESVASDPLLVTVIEPVCGDANRDGFPNITDAVMLIDFIFNQGPAPEPLSVGDCNCDQITNITDAVFLVDYIFNSGSAPCEACP
ncbi:MAG: hypothetical protein ABIJ61_11650 [bacterium]